MKFIYLASNYHHFRGQLFAFKKPTEVTDKATIEALQRNPDFMRVDETEPQKTPMPDECPKCGKVVKRGKYMHQKFCKGK
jgi:hypothetical protein